MNFMKMATHEMTVGTGCKGLALALSKETYLGCLQDISTAVSVSSVVNHPQHVGAQDGTSIVLMYDWGSYLDCYAKKL